MGLNAKQIEQLLRPVNPKRVQKDNSGMSHLAGYDVSAHLTRIFGFGGWEKRITSLELVSEQGNEKNGRTGWWVTYGCQMTLIVKDPAGNVIWSNDDGATGSASNLPSKGDAHDFAMKNAITYALKRCAKDLGDQFGLSLYNKGSLQPLIVRTLDVESKDDADVENEIPGELHPDTDDAGVSETPAGKPADRPARQQGADPAPEADESVIADWGTKIDGITSREDAALADKELREVFKNGRMDATTANAIRTAIKGKVASLGDREMAGASR
jgi:hypothetical protein